jgi:ribosomal protein L37E
VITRERKAIGGKERMLVCTKCNIEYEDGKELCSSCGNPLVAKEKSISNEKKKDKVDEPKLSEKLICPNCKLLYEKMTVCIRCGATLVKEKDIPSLKEDPKTSVTSEVEKEEPPAITPTEATPSTPQPEGQDLSSTRSTRTSPPKSQTEEFWSDSEQLFSPQPSDAELSSPDRVKKEKVRSTDSSKAKKEHPQVQPSKKRLTEDLKENRGRKGLSLRVKSKKDFFRLSSQSIKILILIGVGIYLVWTLISYLITKPSQPSSPPSKEAISPTLPSTSVPTSETSNTTEPKEEQNKQPEQSSSVPKEVTPRVTDTTPSSSVPITSTDLAPESQEKEEIEGLLEKIKKANLEKNIDLFMACYSAKFKDRERKKRLTLASWRNFNYLHLSYNLKGQSISGNTAKARVEWWMGVSPKNGGQAQVSKAVLDVKLVKEDGIWKIIETKPVS